MALETTDVKQVLAAITANYPGIHTGIMAFSALAGLYLIFMGVYHLSTYRTHIQRGMQVSGMLMELVAGSALLSINVATSQMSESVFATADGLRTALDYTNPSGSETTALFITLVGFITLYGWFATFRGWWQLSRYGKPGTASESPVAHGFSLVIFGTLCSNFLFFTDHLAASVGLSNFLRQYIPN